MTSSPTTGTQYAVEDYRGKPTLLIDGKPSPCYTYCYPLSLDLPGAAEIHRKFAAHGCRFYMNTVRGGVDDDWYTTPFWTDDDVFPEITDPAAVAAVNLSRQAQIILDACPDARFWIRLANATPPLRWRQRFQDDLLLDSFGKRFDEPSLASERYLAQVTRYVENIVRFCERQPWADRAVGYLIYPIGEGTTVLTCEGSLFDRSPVMCAGFTDFLRRQYGTDACLREAWGRADVTLATAEVPDDRDFLQRGLTRHEAKLVDDPTGGPTPHRLHWPEPLDTAAERDYCLYMRELTVRYLKALLGPVKRLAPSKLAGIDAFKQTMLGWPLIARWAGDYQAHQGLQHAVSGAFGMAELLDLPELDVVATPHDYLHRGMGFGYEGEGIGDAVVRHGKMMLVEEDQRTFSRSDAERWNLLKDMREMHAGLWRNLGASLSRGYNTYPMDIAGSASFFMDDRTQQILGERRRVHEAATAWERRETPSLVMVVDDWSILEEDFTIDYQYLAMIQQRMYGLSRCGLPFRLHLVEDLAREDFPTCHKIFLFPNLFKITPERLALLREKVFRDGNVAIFGPASGITDGKQLSAETATELTGIPLALIRKESPRLVTIDRFDHPITARLPRLDYGDSFAYGPLLVPQGHPRGPAPHPDVKRLGGIQWPTAWDGDGLVIREFGRGAAGNGIPGPRGAGDYAAVFTCAVPLPDVLLRELARYSGTHIYSETDDLIFADNCTLTVHAVRPGPRAIALPAPSTVWDLISGHKLGEQMTTITFTVDPPQTALFYLGENPCMAR